MKCSNTLMMSMSIFCFIFCSASALTQNFNSIKKGNNSSRSSKKATTWTKANGVSVHHLQTTFAEEVKNYRKNQTPWAPRKFLNKPIIRFGNNDILLQKTTIYDLEDTRKEQNGFIRLKGADVTCPHDKKVGAAYVDCIQGEDNVGEANVMLSYAWGNTVKEIIDVLDQFTLRKGLDPKRTYVWICCLCNNQHRVFESSKKEGGSVSSEEFQQTFENQVMSVDSIVSLMSPWREPKYLKRVWCIFEMHAAHNNNCDITIELPRAEREDLKKIFLKGPMSIEKMFKTLSEIDINKAETRVPEDKKEMLKVVKAGVGVDSLNDSVGEMFRTWFFTQLKEFAEELDADVEKENYGGKDPSEFLADGYQSIVYVFYRHRDYEIALDWCTKQVKLCEKFFGETDIKTVISYNGIASIYKALGQYEEAIKYLKKSIAISEKVYGLDHTQQAAIAYTNIGLVYRRKEELDTALYYFEINRTILYEDVYGKVHARTPEVYNGIGFIHGVKGDYDLAMQYYEDSLKIDKEKIGSDHPSTASTYNNIGDIHKRKGDLDKALEFYFMALHIEEKVHGVKHYSTIQSYENISYAYLKKVDFGKVLKNSILKCLKKKAKLLEE